MDPFLAKMCSFLSFVLVFGKRKLCLVPPNQPTNHPPQHTTNSRQNEAAIFLAALISFFLWGFGVFGFLGEENELS